MTSQERRGDSLVAAVTPGLDVVLDRELCVILRTPTARVLVTSVTGLMTALAAAEQAARDAERLSWAAADAGAPAYLALHPMARLVDSALNRLAQGALRAYQPGESPITARLITVPAFDAVPVFPDPAADGTIRVRFEGLPSCWVTRIELIDRATGTVLDITPVEAHVAAGCTVDRVITPGSAFYARAAAALRLESPIRHAGEIHDERCCMEGAHPDWGPHPDCPGRSSP